MSDRIPSTEKIEVCMGLRMSPDVFRAVQDEFIRDCATLLGCDASEIKILGIHSVRPETPVDFIDAAQLQELGKHG